MFKFLYRFFRVLSLGLCGLVRKTPVIKALASHGGWFHKDQVEECVVLLFALLPFFRCPLNETTIIDMTYSCAENAVKRHPTLF